MHLASRGTALAALLLATGVSYAQEQKPAAWTAGAVTAVKAYQKKVTTSLQPLYDGWRQLADKAAQTPGGPPGSLVPPSPVDTLERYRSLHVLAGLPDKWRVALLAAAAQTRARGAKDKAESKPADPEFARFQPEFAGVPRAVALPRLPEPRQEPKDAVSLEKVLEALEGADDEKGAQAYRQQADRFGQSFQAKVYSHVREGLIELKGSLAKALPEETVEWKSLPEELGAPAAYFLASAYFEGHGGIARETSATGTGDGTAAASPSEGGTGDGKASEPGPAGTGSGDVTAEPGPDGTGSGKTTPKQFKDIPGTGSGKGAKAPGPKGTGGS